MTVLGVSYAVPGLNLNHIVVPWRLVMSSTFLRMSFSSPFEILFFKVEKIFKTVLRWTLPTAISKPSQKAVHAAL